MESKIKMAIPAYARAIFSSIFVVDPVDTLLFIIPNVISKHPKIKRPSDIIALKNGIWLL